ncbi:MAG: hypothetical protein ACYCZO_15475 [Daejeonella sp.]
MKTKKESTNSEIEIGKPLNPELPQDSDPGPQIGQMEKPEPLTDKYVSELLTSDKTNWNFIIPKKNIFIIFALALLCWGIVGLISLLIYLIYP